MAVDSSADLKLSICITTFNRAAYIGETLESILSQATGECEVVVLDAASTDETERVVSKYVARSDRIRYVRQAQNNGIDQDYDRVVEISRGQYCWLMTDDDLIKPDVVASVLQAIRRNVSLVILNFEMRDLSLANVLQDRWLEFDDDRVYGPNEMDRLFVELDEVLMYVGSFVVKRDVWMARQRKAYYGSLFIHAGVVFQQHLPGPALVIAKPSIVYRMGNGHTWLAQKSEIVFSKWPSLVSTMALSSAARRSVRSAEPWRDGGWLLVLRGRGWYSVREYRRWVRPQLRSILERCVPVVIALTPGPLVNASLVIYYSLRKDRGQRLQWMRQSPYHFSRFLKPSRVLE